MVEEQQQEQEQEQEQEKEETEVAPVKRGPGRPRKNPLAPVTPKVGRPRKNAGPTPSTARKGRLAQQQVATEQDEVEDEQETEDSELPPSVPEPESASKDVFDPPSSGDELAAPQRVSNPTPKRRNITRKPRITYKSRRSSLLSRGETDEVSGSEGDPISVTKSSPIMVAKKAVPIPSTPATTIKPRGRPPRARKKGAPEVPVSVEVAPVAMMEVTPSAVVRTRGGRLSYGSLHETDAEGDDDVDMMDEDVVTGDGTIAAAAPVIPAPKEKEKKKERDPYKGRANRRRSLPAPAKKSLALDGMVDPFAIPEGKGDADADQNGGVAGTDAAAAGVAEQEKFSEKAMKALKKRIMAKLMGRKRCKLVGVTEEEAHVRNLLEQTVVAGEGNSMLITGARGSGKTTVCFPLLP